MRINVIVVGAAMALSWSGCSNGVGGGTGGGGSTGGGSAGGGSAGGSAGGTAGGSAGGTAGGSAGSPGAMLTGAVDVPLYPGAMAYNSTTDELWVRSGGTNDAG